MAKQNTQTTKRETHIIDAQGKSLGGLASEIAILLQGKHKPDYAPHKDIGDFVIVKNFDKVRFTGQKLKKKKYYRHSGYLGGLKEETLEEVLKKDPFKVLRRAVLGMLPKNKLRSKMIKRLKLQ
ncbi:MAG: 50S ribosomal protein L13 [Candidatus Pacebacteria bacterium]|nr:50S ribosomal protein L13 [Candidatus Paceibacterota bacterium]